MNTLIKSNELILKSVIPLALKQYPGNVFRKKYISMPHLFYILVADYFKS